MQQLTFLERGRLEWEEVEASAGPLDLVRSGRFRAEEVTVRVAGWADARGALLEHFGKLVTTR